MDGMGMGSMSSGSMLGFTPVNKRYARDYWYAIAGCIGLATSIRIIRLVQSRRRHALHLRDTTQIPSKPDGRVAQAYATITATMREIAYPQPIYFTGPFSKYFSPLPLGRWLVLLAYWAFILGMLWTDVILKPNNEYYAYKWEKPAYRAAWISVTQIPFIYLLSCKFNPISILSGISYERLNWLHRWAARTVFLTIIVHWAFFFHEWRIGGIVKMQFQLMPMIKYGFGAWGVIGWMVLSGFGFFRAKCYELFVAQHIVAAAALLWLLHKHVPAYAAYNIWMSVGFVAFDWGVRILWNLGRNLHVLARAIPKSVGFSAYLEALPGNMVRLVIDDADFSWRAGQHVYLSIPGLRPFELHPFTIASPPRQKASGAPQRLSLVVKAHSGFSKAMHKAALKSTTGQHLYKAFLSGPWGNPPDLHHYDSVVLLACASGASFCVPLLQDILSRQNCVKRATLHWIVRSAEHYCWFGRELESIIEAARRASIDVSIVVHITNSNQQSTTTSSNEKLAPSISAYSVDSKLDASSSSHSDTSSSGCDVAKPKSAANLTTSYGGRPSVSALIRPTVEAAAGETAVVVCGGVSITAQARTFVAHLSDERAVHKGTGAQGIYLFTETYGW